MYNLRAILIAACGLLPGIPVCAQPLTPAAPAGAVGGVPPRPETPARRVPAEAGPGRTSIIPPSGAPISLEAGKGTLIRLPRPASTVFIANPDVADVQVKSPSLIYLTAKAPGQTALYAVDAEDRVLLNAPVRVEHDLSRVRDTLGTVAPGENVAVASVDNALVLSGSVSTAGRAERVRSLAAAIAGETKGTVVNRMAVATPNQVNIRVKVAEVNRQVLKSLGVNWQKLTGAFRFDTDNPVTGGSILNENTLGFVLGGNNARTFATLDALAQENLLVTLAEPNLTATNGQAASFLAGGEFPVPIASNLVNNVQTITIDFKRFGVSLDVVPTIIDPEHLVLKIRSEVSDLTNTGAVTTNSITIPALTVRRAETTVELGSGQSFVLGGLLQHSLTQDVSKIPWLGDIPIIGQLFRSERFQRGETELVIIVTPYLVKPAGPSLATPVDGFRAPHDAQRVINASVYRQGLPAPPSVVGAPGAAAAAPVGFRLD
jgi:pilus assembly protein CpaC